MQALLILAVTFGLMWVLFLLPQQRRVKAHQQLVASLEEGDDVVLTAGIFGRITDLGPEEMLVEVAPSVEIRVARMAVLRRVDDATSSTSSTSSRSSLVDEPADAEPDDESSEAGPDVSTTVRPREED
ncbi:MAG TPA: preprotein translocase subunit YajC [Acidimicrobiales bacterium]